MLTLPTTSKERSRRNPTAILEKKAIHEIPTIRKNILIQLFQ